MAKSDVIARAASGTPGAEVVTAENEPQRFRMSPELQERLYIAVMTTCVDRLAQIRGIETQIHEKWWRDALLSSSKIARLTVEATMQADAE